MLKRMLKKRKGFTIVELIVVVTILGILTAVSVPLVTSYIDDSRVAADNSNAKVIEGVVKRVDAKGVDAADNEFVLSEAVASEVQTALIAELGKVPVPQKKDNKFWLNLTTGECRANATTPAVTGWIDITP
jgi:prepilin-type N-terminal cleavage/methylation domain-containing protein